MKGGAVETPSWESRFGPKLYSFWWIVFTILTFFTGLSFLGGVAMVGHGCVYSSINFDVCLCQHRSFTSCGVCVVFLAFYSLGGYLENPFYKFLLLY